MTTKTLGQVFYESFGGLGRTRVWALVYPATQQKYEIAAAALAGHVLDSRGPDTRYDDFVDALRRTITEETQPTKGKLTPQELLECVRAVYRQNNSRAVE